MAPIASHDSADCSAQEAADVQDHFTSKIYSMDFFSSLQLSAINNIETGLTLIDQLNAGRPDTIHDLRVITKRLRAYWQALKPGLIDQEIFSSHKEQLSNTANLFTRLRENHVNRKLITGFANSCGQKLKKGTLSRLLDLIPTDGVDCGKLEPELRETLTAELRFWKEFEPSILKQDYEFQTGLNLIRHKARGLASDTIDEQMNPALLHRWRKWEKYHFYLCELIDEPAVYPQQTEHIKRLEKMTDILGKSHDIDVLANLVTRFIQQGKISDNKGELLLLIGKQAKQVSQRVLKRYKKLLTCEKKLFE